MLSLHITLGIFIFCLFSYFTFFFFVFSGATPKAYGGSPARGRIRAVAAGLRQSQGNAGFDGRLRPTPQLTAMPDH